MPKRFIIHTEVTLAYIYTRSDKVLRAAAPWGIESPRLTNSPLAKRDLEEYLFNEYCFSYAAVINGSPTAEQFPPLSRLIASFPPAPARAPKACRAGLLQWADVICVMEQ